MKHYGAIKENGFSWNVDFPCSIDDEEKTWVYVEGKYHSFEHHLTVYYREERTWNDHMGNTPCGYYCNVPVPFTNKTRRVYMYS